MAAGIVGFLAIFTGLIFFFGALFVYLTVRVSRSTINDLLKTSVSKSYVDTIIQSMNNSLIIIGTDARIKMVNKATLDILGFSESEIIGAPVNLVFADFDYEKHMGINDLIKKKLITEGERLYLTKDHRKIPVLFSGSIMIDKDEILGLVCVAQDISEYKKAETELKNAVAELETYNMTKMEKEMISWVSELKQEIKKIIPVAKRERA
ncbi:MAG: PAS domain S-box protein [bacterium]